MRVWKVSVVFFRQGRANLPSEITDDVQITSRRSTASLNFSTFSVRQLVYNVRERGVKKYKKFDWLVERNPSRGGEGRTEHNFTLGAVLKWLQSIMNHRSLLLSLHVLPLKKTRKLLRPRLCSSSPPLDSLYYTTCGLIGKKVAVTVTHRL